jgi:cyclopropane fatty-acyl-phospholipid synthase-like methyltransferase
VNQWLEKWSKLSNGGHRFQTEEFLKKESKEKLFHLDGGESIFDFGCGSADLLFYYIPHYKILYGADFSLSMLEAAKLKIKDKVTLVHADNKSVWSKIPSDFDRICSSQVAQYLTESEIQDFVRQALEKLSDEGKIIFFDVIDPRIFKLFEFGFFKNNVTWLSATKSIIHQLIAPIRDMGYAHHPKIFEKIAEHYSLKVEIVWSMYYEYRYHVILTR